MSAGIRFAAGTPWVAVSQIDAERKATEHGPPLWLRLYFRALADVNKVGHAEYGPRVLAQRLEYVDTMTGELVQPTSQALSNAISKAKAYGLVDVESSARCLVLPSHSVQRGAGGSGGCRHHGVGKATAVHR